MISSGPPSPSFSATSPRPTLNSTDDTATLCSRDQERDPDWIQIDVSDDDDVSDTTKNPAHTVEPPPRATHTYTIFPDLPSVTSSTCPSRPVTVHILPRTTADGGTMLAHLTRQLLDEGVRAADVSQEMIDERIRGTSQVSFCAYRRLTRLRRLPTIPPRPLLAHHSTSPSPPGSRRTPAPAHVPRASVRSSSRSTRDPRVPILAVARHGNLVRSFTYLPCVTDSKP